MSNSLPSTIGRYEVLGVIGSGGMGTLYLARDPKLDRQIAIKTLRDVDDQMRERFAREGRSIARLRHRNIVTVFDVGEDDGHPFIAMEYVHGETLAEVIRQGSPLSTPQKLRLIEELCDGLAFAHTFGIIHRDVKPANLMIDSDGELKILDFGIARIQESGVTEAGALIGTLNYMSPEQVAGRAIDARSDIFAVGAVFYELLSCAPAFPGGVLDGVIYRILHEEPTPLVKLCPSLDAETVRIVGRALRKDPGQRYQTLTAMGSDLRRVRGHLEGAVAQSDKPSNERETATLIVDSNAKTRLSRFSDLDSSGSRRRWALGLCLTLAIVVAAFFVVQWPWHKGAGQVAVPGIVPKTRVAAVPPAGLTPDTPPAPSQAVPHASHPPPGVGVIARPKPAANQSDAEEFEAIERAKDAFTQGDHDSALGQILQLSQDEQTRTVLDDWFKSAVSDLLAAQRSADSAGQDARDSSQYREAVAAQEDSLRLSRTDVVFALRRAWQSKNLFAAAAENTKKAAAPKSPTEPNPVASRATATPGAASSEPGERPMVAPSTPPSIEDEKKAVLSVLDDYAAAYRQLDFDGVKNVYPSVDTSLQRIFKQQVKSIQVQFKNQQVSITGNVAEVTCEETNITRPLAGATTTNSGSVTFTLRKSGKTWLIESIR